MIYPIFVLFKVFAILILPPITAIIIWLIYTTISSGFRYFSKSRRVGARPGSVSRLIDFLQIVELCYTLIIVFLSKRLFPELPWSADIIALATIIVHAAVYLTIIILIIIKQKFIVYSIVNEYANPSNLVSFARMGLMSSCFILSGYGASRDSTHPDDTKPASVELPGIPDASVPPPAIPGAGDRFSVLDVIGPSSPHVAWNIALPFDETPVMLEKVGADKTIYLSTFDGVGAVRNGKVLWAYKVDNPTNIGLAFDGSLWFEGSQEAEAKRFFVLNRDGEGGLLPNGFPRPGESEDHWMVGCGEGNRSVVVNSIEGEIPLDIECSRASAKIGPDGLIYVGTDAPDIRAYTTEKILAWKLATPCVPQTMLIGPNSHVVFTCNDNSIHFIDHGVTKWSVQGDGKMAAPDPIPNNASMLGVMDGQGTLYYVDRPENGDGVHVHALSATGKVIWIAKTDLTEPTSMQFDKTGRLYVSAARSMVGRLVAFGK
jgi:hypothetical protein